jgi:hypothetical protein
MSDRNPDREVTLRDRLPAVVAAIEKQRSFLGRGASLCQRMEEGLRQGDITTVVDLSRELEAWCQAFGECDRERRRAESVFRAAAAGGEASVPDADLARLRRELASGAIALRRAGRRLAFLAARGQRFYQGWRALSAHGREIVSYDPRARRVGAPAEAVLLGRQA